ncbi:MAG: hypothetical protein KatS3mg057_1032 [Herpetosiphonaceae bacterium]|nr:MAG: hypothetical protein KatS3mg057_1032 [Herpetosiphonaceae bacterium]
MFKEYEVVKLKRNIPLEELLKISGAIIKHIPPGGLNMGAQGTIVMVYPGSPPGFDVEFVDEEGYTVAILTLKEDDLEKV